MDSPIDECKSLIKNFPLFVLLNDSDLDQLAALMKKNTRETGDIIVKENEIIDWIYLIADGRASVTRQHTTVERSDTLQLGMLTKGDGIGLAHTAFFSPTSLRTATVTALTPMTLYEISLTSFYNFLTHTVQRYPALTEAAEKILLINFIKKSKNYSLCSTDELLAVVDKIKKVTFAENTFLYKKGEPTDGCYIVLNGEVLLFREQSSPIKIEQGGWAGEDDFFAERNHGDSAKTKTECDLFFLTEKNPHEKLSSSVFTRFINYFKSLF